MASKHYVNNKDFFNALVAYKKQRAAAAAEGKPQPKIPEYIGVCIKEIATRWTSKPQYASYPFREEMISDAIENCFLYLHNFNEEKTQNPFAYFTQIIKFACWRRIDKEKEELYIKLKSAQKFSFNHEFFNLQDTDQSDYDTINKTDNPYTQDFIETFEAQLKEKKLRRKQKQDEKAEQNDQ